MASNANSADNHELPKYVDAVDKAIANVNGQDYLHEQLTSGYGQLIRTVARYFQLNDYGQDYLHEGITDNAMMLFDFAKLMEVELKEFYTKERT